MFFSDTKSWWTAGKAGGPQSFTVTNALDIGDISLEPLLPEK